MRFPTVILGFCVGLAVASCRARPSPSPSEDAAAPTADAELAPAEASAAAAPGTAVASPRGPVLHVPIPEKVREGQARFAADWSFDLRAESGWTAHVHVIPTGQLVPLHHHPEHEELVFVAQGQGEWTTAVHREGKPVAVSSAVATAGSLLHAPAGSSHSLRNRKEEPLAAVVLHRPPFGQNWYLLATEVQSQVPTVGVPVGGELPDSLYPGWEEAWVGSGAPQTVAPAQDWLLLVARGEGTLVFEEHRLGLAVGTFASLPAGLEFQLDGGADLLALQIQVPHPPSIP